MSDEFLGQVKTWKGDRGFGFIGLDDGRDAFCHFSALRASGLPGDYLPTGQRVRVTLAAASDGRLRVDRIAVAGECLTIPSSSG